MNVKTTARLLPYQVKYARDLESFSSLVAGYGSGKSDAVFYRAFQLNKYRRSQGIKCPVIGITAPSYRILNDSNIIDFETLFNKYNIKYKFHKQDKRMVLKGSNSGEFWFRSVDQPENIVGFDATDMIHDEFDIAKVQKQRQTLIKSSARLRQGGVQDPTQSFVSTAEGYKLLYELFVEEEKGTLIKARTYWNTFLTVGYLWNMIFRVYGSNVPKEIPEDLILAYENYRISKIKDTSEKIRLKRHDLIKTYDKYYDLHYSPLLAQYCGGEFVNVEGLSAYYGFKREVNLIKYDSNIENQLNEIWVGMDFNVNPMSAVFGYPAIKNDRKKIVIFDEVEIWNGNTFKMAEFIAQKFPHKRIMIFPDMTGGARKTSAVMTDIQILQKAGFQIRGTKNKYQRDSLNIVNKTLIDSDVLIMDNCKKLINDLDKVIRDEFGNIDKKDPKITHMSDAFRYIVDRNFKQLATTRKGR